MSHPFLNCIYVICNLSKIGTDGLFYLFNGISTPYGLFKAEIWFIYKCLIIIITIYIFIYVPLKLFFVFKFVYNNNLLTQLIKKQVFLSNTNNFLFDSGMWLEQVLQLWVSGPGSNGNTLYCQEPHYQMQFCLILRTTPFLRKRGRKGEEGLITL